MANFLGSLPKIGEKKKKRVGRGLGSGRGSKSGRGTTRHQKAREDIPLYFEGGQGRMVKKFPLLRGKGKNKPVTPKPIILNLSALSSFRAGSTVSIKELVEKGIVDKSAYRRGVKVLNRGKLEKKLNLRLKVSGSVKKIIESLGGRILE